ncbi:MAG: hypothetical protein GBAus27B_000181 [Mycoplasmataceae bacterium]|nr:MAG: hypothetical protein GBAus27B_000181 [Mycoplasmataceae bacterium]
MLDGNIKFLDYSNIPIREFDLPPNSFSPPSVVTLLVTLPTFSNQHLLTYDPDDYLRPFDIVKREINQFANHVAIYLGNKKVCHIYDSDERTQADLENNLTEIATNRNNRSFFSSSSSSSNSSRSNSNSSSSNSNSRSSRSNSNSDSNNSQASQAQVEINTENLSARIDSWERFIDGKHKVICIHPVIHTKNSQLIIEHLKKSLQGEYGKGEYSVISKNCEHFTNLIIYGVNYSDQATKYLLYSYVQTPLGLKKKQELKEDLEKIKRGERIDESIFNALEKKRELTAEEQQIFQELEARIETPPK